MKRRTKLCYWCEPTYHSIVHDLIRNGDPGWDTCACIQPGCHCPYRYNLNMVTTRLRKSERLTDLQYGTDRPQKH